MRTFTIFLSHLMNNCTVSLRKKSSGHAAFTLIELLLTIGIISLLISVLIGIINPAGQLANARNTERKANMRAIMESYSQYAIDHLNRFQPYMVNGETLAEPCKLSITPKKVCKFSVSNGIDTGECGHPSIDCIYSAHLSGAYLSEMYLDPAELQSEWEIGNEAYKVNYAILQFPGTYRLKMISTNPENDTAVEISM